MSTPGDADNPQQEPGQPPHEQPAQPDPGQQYGQQYGQQGQWQSVPPPPYQQGPPPTWSGARAPGSDDGFWAPAAHWGALVTWVLTSGVLAFLAPLVIMQTKGQTSPVVRRHAVASLNFQLSMLIYALVSGLAALVGAVLSFILVGIPILVVALLALLAVAVVSFVMPIIAAVRASNGEDYSYPVTIRLVS